MAYQYEELDRCIEENADAIRRNIHADPESESEANELADELDDLFAERKQLRAMHRQRNIGRAYDGLYAGRIDNRQLDDRLKMIG